MKRVAVMMALIAALAAAGAGCKSNKGAQEFIPGKGWRPID